jgi:hypothetical protein
VQRYVLAVLYYSTGGDNWDVCSASESATCNEGRSAPYLSGENVCSWYNTECDSVDGNLIEINLGTFHIQY